MNEKSVLIYENHWGGGSTKRWIDGKYLVSATYATGSNIHVESLDFPSYSTSGWFYQWETENECVTRLISKLEIESDPLFTEWVDLNVLKFGKVITKPVSKNPFVT